MTNDQKFFARKKTKHLLFRALFQALPIPLISPEIYDLIADLKQSRKSIDVKIDEASDSLKRTTELIEEIEENLEFRAQRLVDLKHELERYSALANLEEAKAKAIIQQIELATDKGKIKERWIGFVINIIAGLILGLLLSSTVSKVFKGLFKPFINHQRIQFVRFFEKDFNQKQSTAFQELNISLTKLIETDKLDKRLSN